MTEKYAKINIRWYVSI